MEEPRIVAALCLVVLLVACCSASNHIPNDPEDVIDFSSHLEHLELIGCYRDDPSRVMGKVQIQDRAAMSNDLCMKKCKIMSTRYAATQAGMYCFCDNRYDVYGVANNCNAPCPGNTTTTCGGAWANQVFKIVKD